MSTTTNLSDFGTYELEQAEELLEAMRKEGLPDEFYDDGTHIMMNQSSGNVFLTNSEYQVAMLTDSGALEMWYNSPYEGIEGFLEDLLDSYETMGEEDREWFKELYLEKGDGILPLIDFDGNFIFEGDEYFVYEEGENEVLESTLDQNSKDYDEYERDESEIFKNKIEAYEAMANYFDVDWGYTDDNKFIIINGEILSFDEFINVVKQLMETEN